MTNKKQFGPLIFDEALPRLVATYNKGKLVPFTGSGISARNIPTWEGFLRNLCKETGTEFPQKGRSLFSDELIQLSDYLVTGLLRKSYDHYITAIKKSLGYESTKPPPTKQCQALSKIFWPLVLTTNYDIMYLDCLLENQKLKNSHREKSGYHENAESKYPFIFGRSSQDCHSLLATIKAGTNTAYWALQGLIDFAPENKNLENEIVVGYRQYRNATHNNLTFRAAFAEIFRNHSLLFMGTGLSEDYFRGLFGEVLERFGSNPFMHCALFNEKYRDTIDHHFLHTRFNIATVYYTDKQGEDEHNGLIYALETLHNEINSEQQKLWKMRYGLRNFKILNNTEPAVGLELIAGTMPERNGKDCFVFSAGFDNTVLLSHVGEAHVNKNFPTYDYRKFRRLSEPLIFQYENTNIFAAVARNIGAGFTSRDARDLRVILQAVEQALVIARDYPVINMMLLAAGQGKKFPAIYSFIQMLRGYKKFIRHKAFNSLLKIYITDPSVLYYIRTRPLEIEELLHCDDIRLEIEIRDNNEIDRSQLYISQNHSLESVSDFYSINPQHWKVTVQPIPYKDYLINVDDKNSLADLGIIPGSLLVYWRKS